MRTNIDPEYLTMAQLEIYANASCNTLKKWVKLGMPCYQVDRKKLVRKGEFNEWMTRYRQGTSQDLDAMLDQVMKEVRQ